MGRPKSRKTYSFYRGRPHRSPCPCCGPKFNDNRFSKTYSYYGTNSPPVVIHDLRDVFKTVSNKAYWRADDAQITGAEGTTSRLFRVNGGDFFGGGDITPTSGLQRFLPLRVAISTGGNRGTARFDCSFDGGVSFFMSSVLTAADVSLVGPGAGTSLVFSNTTYTSGNIFINAMERWNDRGIHDFDMRHPVSQYYLGCRIQYSNWANLGEGTTMPTTQPIVITEPSGGGPSDTGHSLPIASASLPAPSEAPTYITGIIRQRTITGSSVERTICMGSATDRFRVMIRGDGVVTVNNGTSRTVPTTYNKFEKWVRFRVYFSNSSDDFVQFGADRYALSATGNNSTTTFRMLMRDSATEGAAGSAGTQGLAEFSIWHGRKPTDLELQLEDEYYAEHYGCGVITA